MVLRTARPSEWGDLHLVRCLLSEDGYWAVGLSLVKITWIGIVCRHYYSGVEPAAIGGAASDAIYRRRGSPPVRQPL
jgi:hypothetical protein